MTKPQDFGRSNPCIRPSVDLILQVRWVAPTRTSTEGHLSRATDCNRNRYLRIRPRSGRIGVTAAWHSQRTSGQDGLNSREEPDRLQTINTPTQPLAVRWESSPFRAWRMSNTIPGPQRAMTLRLADRVRIDIPDETDPDFQFRYFPVDQRRWSALPHSAWRRMIDSVTDPSPSGLTLPVSPLSC